MPAAPKAHNARQAPRKRVDRRASASERGYDQRWTRLRATYVAQHPLCEDCLATGRMVRVHEVDHVIPIEGIADPLRLLWDNLRSRCRAHHAAKTARHDDTIRAEYERTGDEMAVIGRWRDAMVVPKG